MGYHKYNKCARFKGKQEYNVEENEKKKKDQAPFQEVKQIVP